MDLRTFADQLQTLVGRPTSLRPFVCDGSPLDCEIFIVGANPATTLERDWWDFWDPGRGYRYAEWFEHYRQERTIRPLKPGRTRRAAISNTRRVISGVVAGAAPVKCLETNVYSSASAAISDLSDEHRVTRVFDFLLTTIRPTVIIAHGKDAVDHLEARARAGQHDARHLLTESHFSRGWSQEAAMKLGQQARALAIECRR